MRKIYCKPEILLHRLSDDDVIRTSGEQQSNTDLTVNDRIWEENPWGNRYEK